MIVSIGTNIKEGPWGGGNLFAINLTNFLKKNGHTVVSDLSRNDIDIILLTEPRRTSESSSFTNVDVLKYIKFKNDNSIVIHRINECDERKNTKNVNNALLDANKVADSTVFVSRWLKELFLKHGILNKKLNVILGGANSKIFNPEGYNSWSPGQKLKIVTHHWGANLNKGFDTYNLLDKMLESSKWENLIEFTYIGNLPKNFKFKNSKVVEPLSGQDLAKEIKKNHVYVTGSINEPSGNHHIEAAQCGLPILYINSGGIPEYCKNFGVMYEFENFEEKLVYVIDNFQELEKNMKSYPYNSDKMSQDYLELFESLISRKSQVIDNRSLPKLRFIDSFYKLQNKLNFR